MSNVSILNTDAGLAAKTVDLLESDQTITGLKTFSRGAAVPFAVAAGSLNVPNLDADKLDGQDWTLPTIVGATLTDNVTLSNNKFIKGKNGAATAFNLLGIDGSDNVVLGNTSQNNPMLVQTGAGDIVIKPNGTEVARFVVGGGLKFPAAQAASADVNTLDDYEEGTWTVGLAFGGLSVGMTFSARAGWYVKIGKLVTFGGSFVLSAKGSSVGNAALTGLPFTVENVAAAASAIFFGRSFNLAVGSYLGATIPINGTTANINILDGSAANDTTFNNTSATDGFFGFYKASA